jgi:alkylation response protein AidB-like acyl-CoA dehydrogenase
MSILQLTEDQKAIIEAVREFNEREVIPVADELERDDEYPEKIVEQMKEMGLFGMMVPEEYGGLGMPLTTYALVIVELARGWTRGSSRPTAPRTRSSGTCRG